MTDTDKICNRLKDEALTINDNGPSILLSTLPIFNLLFRTTHFTDEEIESECLSVLSKVTHLVAEPSLDHRFFKSQKACPPTTTYCTPNPPFKNNTGDERW